MTAAPVSRSPCARVALGGSMPRAAWLCQAFWHPLHAEVSIAAHNREGRKGLERLCHYLSRLPIPQDRLERRRGRHVRLVAQTHRRGARGAAPLGSRRWSSSRSRSSPKYMAALRPAPCTLPGAPTLPWRLHRTCGPKLQRPASRRPAIVPTPPGLPPCHRQRGPRRTQASQANEQGRRPWTRAELLIQFLPSWQSVSVS